MMNEQYFDERMKDVASKIQSYLQIECNDLWSTSVENGVICAYFSGNKRFEVIYDKDFEDWYVTGEHVGISILADINTITTLYEERGL